MKVKVEGLRDCERALAELPKATGKNALRRVAKGALGPMQGHAAAIAPREFGDLAMSIQVSEKRTPRAKKRPARRKVGGRWKSDPSTGIEMAMGPTRGKGVLNYASFQEFGTVEMAANPYMRPAWDSGAMKALDYIKDELRAQIDKAAARLAKKRAKAGA